MLSLVLIACVLVGVTVAVHAAGLAVLLLALRKWHLASLTRFWPITRLLLLMTWWVVLFHLVEISICGLFHWWWGCLPDAESAFYFSGVTYSSIGFGDLVLATPWRLLAPIEGLTGVLMCGLSAGIFFAVVSRIHQARHPSPLTAARAFRRRPTERGTHATETRGAHRVHDPGSGLIECSRLQQQGRGRIMRNLDRHLVNAWATAGLAAVAASQAHGAAEATLPAAVAAALKSASGICSEAGGKPLTADAVKRADLNRDGKDDFVLDVGSIHCDGG